MNVDFDLTELSRRLSNVITIGKVIDTDYTGNLPRVCVAIGELSTAWLPILSLRAGPDSHWWPLEKGEQVVVLSTSGELAQGVVLGSIHHNAYPATSSTTDVHRTTYSDGAVIEYDRRSHHLKAILPTGAKTEIVSDGGLTITGNVSVAGDIHSSGDISDKKRSMNADRKIFNQHTHPGVKTGPDSSLPPDFLQ